MEPQHKNNKYSSFRVLLTQTLSRIELNIIYQRYGLIAEEKTLEEIGKHYSLTRERIRQKEKKALEKIKNSINNGELGPELINKISEYANNATPIAQIKDISNEYINTGILKLISKIFPNLFTLFNDSMLEQDFLILSDDTETLKSKIEKTKACLSGQETFVKITELSQSTKCQENIIRNLKNIAIEGNYIALRSNERIFKNKVTSMIEYTLEKNGKPMNIKEIAEKTGITLNSVRGAIDRINNAVNIGPSIYALTYQGYIKGHLEDVVEYYLKMAGEPLEIKQILSLVKKQRLYKPSSVIAILSKKRFKRIAEGVYGLRDWDYDEYITPFKIHDIQSKEAILQVLGAEPTQIIDIIKNIQDKFGERTTDSRTTIHAALLKLASDGAIKKIEKGTTFYYFK